MSASIYAPAFPSRARVVTASLWTLTAVSSIVFVEPAPFDLLVVGLSAFFLVLGLRMPRDLTLPLLLMAVFLLANSVSIIFASPGASLPGMLFYAGLTAYLVVVWLLLTCVVAADADHVLRVLWSGWIFAAVLAVTLGLGAYFRLLPGYETFMMVGRAKAAFKDANVYGPFLIPVALYALAQMRGGRLTGNLPWLLLFLYLAIGLLIGFSRGAWGNFFASLIVFAVLVFLNARSLRDYLQFFWAGGAVIALTIVLVVAAVSTPKIGKMFSHRAALLHRYDVEAGGRFATQKAALVKIAQNPIGIGPNQTHQQFGRVPHNVYLKIAAENGWIGGLAFVAFLVVTLWKGLLFALRPGPLQPAFAVAYASTVGIVAESVIIDTMHWRHFFVLLAMVWGAMMANDLRAQHAKRVP